MVKLCSCQKKKKTFFFIKRCFNIDKKITLAKNSLNIKKYLFTFSRDII